MSRKRMLATEEKLRKAIDDLYDLRHFIHPNYEGVSDEKAIKLWEHMEEMKDTLHEMVLETVRGEYKVGEFWNEYDLAKYQVSELLKILPDKYRCYLTGAKPETVNHIFGTKKPSDKQVIALFNVVSTMETDTKLIEWYRGSAERSRRRLDI